MIIAWGMEAWADYTTWQQEDKKTVRRINMLIKDIVRNGYQGVGKPEPLRHMDGGWWSRRIDKKNRLVYRLVEERLEIIQCKEHYTD